MKQALQSHNSSPWPIVKQLLVPSLPKVLLEVLAAVLLLALLNGRGIWNSVNSGSLVASHRDVGDIISENALSVYNFIDSFASGRLLQAAFWIFVGCTAYILIWLVGNILYNIRNDVVAGDYVHPRTYNRLVYWESILARKFLFSRL